MELPGKNEDYCKQDYWNSRYVSEESYDWFAPYSRFKHLVCRDIQTSDSILMLGCGNSTLSEEMYHDGFRCITNIDFSPVVIDKMAIKHKKCSEMKWLVMDILDMKFPNEAFDVILEKGTIDALMVHEKDPWNVSEETIKKIDKILEQVSNILKPGGKFISITFAQPHFRRPLYAQSKYSWSVCLSSFGDTFHFFYFVMEKGQSLSLKDQHAEEIARQKKLAKDECPHVPLLEEDSDDFLMACEL